MTAELDSALRCALVTALLAVAYVWAWRRRGPQGTTPTGFGAALGLALLITSRDSAVLSELTIALAIVAVGAAIYWIDDFTGLSARFRVIFSFVIGVAIGAAFVRHLEFGPPSVGIPLLAGGINVALVNTINFQDGADLNLACFIVLTAILLFAFAPDGSDWKAIALACLGFTLPFALLNSRPQTLYFGDSGSFVFASLLTIMGVAYLLSGDRPPPEAAIPAALPIVDMAFVTTLRIRIRQRFTVRHYFHLYQRLQKDRGRFFYLLPQLVSVVFSLGAATLLQAWGMDRTAAVALGTSTMSLLTFLLFRRLFVTSEPGPPKARGAAA